MLIGISPDATAPHSVRLVISGGEALDFKLLAPYFENPQTKCRIVNMYGITETTVHVTHRDVVPADLACSVRGFLGGALPSLHIYILGREMRPVPVGSPGEIYVGGDQLARGYWKRPDLTAERFVPDPFSPVPGQRLYQSGDLARWHENGELEYVGRADRQVKVRGFRVELGEIEAALRRCQHVRDAAVIQRSESESSRLVAFVVMQDAASLDELRRELLELLPEYMIPASFVQLSALPLTPNGKLDREALPAYDEPAQEIVSYVAPRTPAESILADIWKEVLGLPRVSIHDNFFTLGGDSILGLQISSLARQKGLAITPASLFRLQTLGALAAAGPNAECFLFIAIHHLVVDTVSWRILIEDLESAYDQLGRNHPVQFFSHSSAYDEWARALLTYSRDFHQTRKRATGSSAPPRSPNAFRLISQTGRTRKAPAASRHLVSTAARPRLCYPPSLQSR